MVSCMMRATLFSRSPHEEHNADDRDDKTGKYQRLFPYTNGMMKACVMTSGEALKATTTRCWRCVHYCSLYFGPAGIPEAV